MTSLYFTNRRQYRLDQLWAEIDAHPPIFDDGSVYHQETRIHNASDVVSLRHAVTKEHRMATIPMTRPLNKVVKLRMPEDEWTKLVTLSLINRRSVNSEILTAIERYTSAPTDPTRRK